MKKLLLFGICMMVLCSFMVAGASSAKLTHAKGYTCDFSVNANNCWNLHCYTTFEDHDEPKGTWSGCSTQDLKFCPVPPASFVQGSGFRSSYGEEVSPTQPPCYTYTANIDFNSWTFRYYALGPKVTHLGGRDWRVESVGWENNYDLPYMTFNSADVTAPCGGQILTIYRDADEDSYGDPLNSREICVVLP